MDLKEPEDASRLRRRVSSNFFKWTNRLSMFYCDLGEQEPWWHQDLFLVLWYLAAQNKPFKSLTWAVLKAKEALAGCVMINVIGSVWSP